MKRFISIITVTIIFISMLSCREVEELAAPSENKSNEMQLMSRAEQNSENNTNNNDSSTNDSSLEGEPQRDKIKW